LHQPTAAIAARFGAIAVEEPKVKRVTTSAKATVERPGKPSAGKAGLNKRSSRLRRYKAERAAAWFSGDRREEHLAAMVAMRPHGPRRRPSLRKPQRQARRLTAAKISN
jgi:hypothetical protein